MALVDSSQAASPHHQHRNLNGSQNSVVVRVINNGSQTNLDADSHFRLPQSALPVNDNYSGEVLTFNYEIPQHQSSNREMMRSMSTGRLSDATANDVTSVSSMEMGRSVSSLRRKSVHHRHHRHHHQHKVKQKKDPLRDSQGNLINNDDYWITSHRRKAQKLEEAVDGDQTGENEDDLSSIVLAPRQRGQTFHRDEQQYYRRRPKHWAAADRDTSSLPPLGTNLHQTKHRWIDPDDIGDVIEESSPINTHNQIYFKFRGAKQDDLLNDTDLLIKLQAHCRSWLARQKFKECLKQNKAIIIIQRNFRLVLDPWVRLFWNLRPFIDAGRLEEELLYFKSEVERYKRLLKMLRFENVEYQARITHLIQLIDQLSTGDLENKSLGALVGQINTELAHSKNFWDEMAAENQSLQTASIVKKPRSLVNAESPVSRRGSSPNIQPKMSTSFYRDQIELLREEATENEYRNGQHYKAQLDVLSDRIEQLQNELATEAGRAARLDRKVVQMEAAADDNDAYQRNLEQVVSQLGQQLAVSIKTPEQSRKASTPGYAVDGGSELIAYRNLVEQLRMYLAENPKLLAGFANSPFEPGGQHDLFTHPLLTAGSASVTGNGGGNAIAATPAPRFFAQPSMDEPMTPMESQKLFKAERAVDELKQQLEATEASLKEREEQLQIEGDERERYELESLQLTDEVDQLKRKLLRLEAEHDESVQRTQLGHERKTAGLVGELDDERRTNERLVEQIRGLEKQVSEFRINSILSKRDKDEDEDSEEGESSNAQWESKLAKYRSEFYQSQGQFNELREEFNEYRDRYNVEQMNKLVAEKDQVIAQLDKDKHQFKTDIDILQVKLQSTTKLLDDTESQAKLLGREKSQQANRIAALENERDEAARSAALASGRASADKESLAARHREIEQLQLERDVARRELVEVSKKLAGISAEGSTEKKHLESRLRDLETHNNKRIEDLKEELEHYRGEVEHLQHQLQLVQSDEAKAQAVCNEQKRRIMDLDEKIASIKTKLIHQERANRDLETELGSTRTNLILSRETLNNLRSQQMRANFQSMGDFAADNFFESSSSSPERSPSSSRNNLISDNGTTKSPSNVRLRRKVDQRLPRSSSVDPSAN